MSGDSWMGVAGSRALEDGADIVIINRFGRQEREGKGLSYLIERALSADIPVVIAVPAHRFADWIRFAGGMSVKLRCDRDALDAWWNDVFPQGGISVTQGYGNVCEVLNKIKPQISRAAGQRLQRLLLVPAFLAGKFDARRAFFRREAVGRAAFAANSLDSGIALLHDERLARHGFADQAFSLFPLRLLRHLSAPAMKTEAGL
jgi:hypothetical protein